MIPLSQQKIQILIQYKKARRQLGGEYVYEQQRKSIPPCFDSNKNDPHTECNKKSTMGSNIAKGMSEGKEQQRLTTPRECRDQGKVPNN